MLIWRDGQAIGDKIDYVTCLNVERWLPARAWSFQKHRNCLPLGDPSASGAIALTQFRLHSKPQKRKQPFFSAGPLKRSTRPGNTSEPNRSGLRQRPAGDGRPQPVQPRGLPPAPPGGGPPVHQTCRRFSAQRLHQPSSFPSQAAGSGCKGEDSKAGMGAGAGAWPIAVDDLCL